MRRLIRWLRRRYQPEDQIGFQGVEYDEKTGKLKPLGRGIEQGDELPPEA